MSTEYIQKPVTLEDFVSNVQFQLDNVKGYLEWAKTNADAGLGNANCKAGCVCDAAGALKAELEKLWRIEREKTAPIKLPPAMLESGVSNHAGGSR
ncbi:MAG TPA: hypothetical protein VK742_20325 [Candidatus Sulfotelmatobacter sp.]|jgi:hypothetical protein|nr:hypothetical protein [Candidatus Sulfotelmatobacter sp.]